MAKAADDEAAGPPLTIWAVSDGRAGMEAQVVGLAAAVARLRPAKVTTKRIGWKFGLGRLPTALNPGLPATLAEGSDVAPPWPDIWIAAGRATLPLSTRLRARSGGRAFIVQTQHPRTRLAAFDLVVPPAHDALAGDNVFPILGAPNRITAELLDQQRNRWRDQLDPLPRPRVAVIVGGRSRAFDLPADLARRLGGQIAEAVAGAGGSVMVSFTRRTPAPAREALRGALAALPGVIWDETGDNPYLGYLASADAIVVTEDSTNLATDAAATGAPVFVAPLSGRSDKFRRFHEDLRGRGIARPFPGPLETWTYAPLAETDRAARELLRRYDARNRRS